MGYGDPASPDGFWSEGSNDGARSIDLIIALGIILWISGSIIGDMGIIYHAGGWFNPSWQELIWVFYLGVGTVWSGIIALILGVFGIITTFIREYLDKGQKTLPSGVASPSPLSSPL